MKSEKNYRHCAQNYYTNQLFHNHLYYQNNEVEKYRYLYFIHNKIICLIIYL